MAEYEFNFEAEYSLLDIGATSTMMRTGRLRPTLFAFTEASGVQSIGLDWSGPSGDPRQAVRAFEEARRHARDLHPVAYAVIAHLTRHPDASHTIHLPNDEPPIGNEYLGVSMYASDGTGRSVIYPVRHSAGKVSFGMPLVEDGAVSDWCPVGDLWANPYCAEDVVRFRPRERAVDPSSPLWHSIVELTRLRMHEDPDNADEYMSYLDDLRNGLFVVAGRDGKELKQVHLRSRTNFNPIGLLRVDADRLLLVDSIPANIELVGAEPA
ncbi:MAG: hypothetical protein ABJA67_09995 [Chthonomonadales bacterium]